jgi:4-azaleucine resistance transporter AzlC
MPDVTRPSSVAALAAPVGLGLFSLGLAFGLVVVHAGLDWWWATVFTAVVYAGSLEFLLVGLATAAAPLLVVASTTLIVNLRHVFYALSFPLDRVDGVLAKVYSTYALTDEAYAVTSVEPRDWTSRRILLVQLIFQVAWVSGATIGALAGSALPIERVQGLDFALTALFVVLAIDAYRVRPEPLLAAGAAGCAVVAWFVVPEQMLVLAFVGYTALLIGRLGLERRGSADG